MSCGIVDDIEDILKNDNELSDLTNDELNRSANKSFILPKFTKKSPKNNQEYGSENNYNIDETSNIPGLAKIWLKTWGCTHNTSDSEYMAGQLSAYGYKIVEEANDADLWLLNSCTVKNPAEDHFKNYIDKAKSEKKYLVLAGCVPQGAPKSPYIQGCSIIGVQQIDRIVEVVEQTLNGNSVRLFGKKKKDNKKYGGANLNLPKIRRNPLVEIIAINTGCLNECTYCKTKHARGELGSYNVEEIVERVKQSFAEGVVEIWLTSEDTGAYGKDIGTSIVELLWKIVEHIPEECFLRIGMTNPPYILEHLEQMALILDHPRVYSFLHIPIQSASDAVLQDMKREYSCDDFKHIVDFLRQKIPNINILTDIICGFPTETEADFELTLDLIRQYKFSSLFINQFFQRPGTPAARMRQIPTQERKRRTKLVSELFNSYTSYDHKLGSKFSVLVTEVSHDEQYYVAHNKFYEQVLVPKIEVIMGRVIQVEIVECTKFSMIGKILDDFESFSQVPIKYKKGEISGLRKLKNFDQNNNKMGDCCGGSCECSTGTEKVSTEESCCSSAFEKNISNEESGEKDRLRHYALITLSAFGIILISRIVLKFLD